MTPCLCGVRHPIGCCAECGRATGEMTHRQYDCERDRMVMASSAPWRGRWLVPVVCLDCLPALYRERFQLARNREAVRS